MILHRAPRKVIPLKTMKELIAACTAMLQSKGMTGMASSRPCAPMAVVYGGDGAHRARSAMDAVFNEVWRARTEKICQFVLRGDEILSSEADGTSNSLPEQELYARITAMYEATLTFLNMKQGIMCFVAVMDDYRSLEELQAAWHKAEALKEQLQFPHLMCVMVLDEGMGKTQFSSEVRAWLMQSTLPTLLLSNVLENDSRLGAGSITKAYMLAASVMVIANTWDQRDRNYDPKFMSLFPIFGNRLMTASYSRIERPDREICETVLFRVLNWISEKMREGKLVPHAEFSKRLKLGNEPGNLLEVFYDAHIKQLLPDGQILESFPRMRSQNPIANQRFQQFDEETFGVFEGFFKMNCCTVVENIDSDVMRRFRTTFRATLEATVNTLEASKSLDEISIEKILDDMPSVVYTGNEGAFSYMNVRAKELFFKSAMSIVKEELLRWHQVSIERVNNFTKLAEEFHDVFMAKNDELERFYANIADTQLKGEPGDTILARFSRISGREDMLQALKDCVSEIYKSDAIFSVALAEEMSRRLEMAGDQVNVQINQQLVGNLVMYFKPIMTPTFCHRALIMDGLDNNGHPTTLFRYLDEYFDDVMCIDTGNSNRVDLIELYSCNYI